MSMCGCCERRLQIGSVIALAFHMSSRGNAGYAGLHCERGDLTLQVNYLCWGAVTRPWLKQ